MFVHYTLAQFTKVRDDLSCQYESEFESLFVEVELASTQNIVVGCVYKHFKMCIADFMKKYMSNILHKFGKENELES